MNIDQLLYLTAPQLSSCKARYAISHSIRLTLLNVLPDELMRELKKLDISKDVKLITKFLYDVEAKLFEYPFKLTNIDENAHIAYRYNIMHDEYAEYKTKDGTVCLISDSLSLHRAYSDYIIR